MNRTGSWPPPRSAVCLLGRLCLLHRREVASLGPSDNGAIIRRGLEGTSLAFKESNRRALKPSLTPLNITSVLCFLPALFVMILGAISSTALRFPSAPRGSHGKKNSGGLHASALLPSIKPSVSSVMRLARGQGSCQSRHPPSHRR
jgi:hypothetical protein